MSQAEIELLYYGFVKDFSLLESAESKEEHWQYERKCPKENGKPAAKQRIRNTIIGGHHDYTETIKVETEKQVAGCNNIEITTPVTKEYFEAWRDHFAFSGCHKVRYTFKSKKVSMPIEGQEIILPEVKFEIDVFFNTAGKRCNMVKIDVEIDHVLEVIKTNHPAVKDFKFNVNFDELGLSIGEAFNGDTDDKEKRTLIDEFWAMVGLL